MKVLVNTYDTAYQNLAGGVHNRIDRIVNELRNEGIIVEYFDKFKSNIADYDILHIFKLDAASKQLVEYANSVGVKVVISSIVSIEKGRLVDLYWMIRKLPIATIYRQLFSIISNTDAVIVESPVEKDYIHKHYHLESSKIHVVPNGADSIECADKSIFDKIDITKPYALVISRFDPNKNQLNLIRAMKNKEEQLVLIGGADPAHKGYYQKCLEEAEGADNIIFLGWLDSKDKLFLSALSHAKVIVCPSFNETFGLSIIEGVIAGAVPAVSKGLPILEYEIFKNCITFKPNDSKDILNNVKKAFNSSNNISAEAKKIFSWNSVAKDHIKIYRELINER